MDLIEKLGQVVLSQAGITALILLVGNVVLFRLFQAERIQNLNLQEELRKLSMAQVEAIAKMSTAIELLKERLHSQAG